MKSVRYGDAADEELIDEIPWVQTFGPFAELVAPAEWRDALRSNLDAMQSKYGT